MAGFGETLRQARAHKGVTLREAEQATRINRHHLAALEEESFDALPPLIYQRGIVRNYAAYLGLDPSKLISMFEEAHGITATGSNGSVAPPPIDMPSHWAPNFAIIGFAVVLSAIVFAWGYSIYVTPPTDDPQATVTAVANTPLADSVEIATELPDAPVPPTVAPTQPPAPTATTAGNTEVGGRQNADRATEAPAASETYITGLAIEASNDLDLTVVVDGEVVYDDLLPAGAVTDEFVGSLFTITTSANESTTFINACGDRSQVPNMEGTQTFEFPANEGSCKP
jgi:cytoskeletal protein RodZ